MRRHVAALLLLFAAVHLACAQEAVDCGDDGEGEGEGGAEGEAPAVGEWTRAPGSTGNNFYGLTYSPFGLGDGKTCPPWDDTGGFCLTAGRVATDLAIIASMTRRIRTYSIDPCYELVVQICQFARDNGMKIQLGVWLENIEEQDTEEIVKLGLIVEEFSDVVFQILVGNEVVSVVGGTREYVERRLLEARKVLAERMIAIPIGTADVWPIYMEGDEAEGIVAASDFIGLNNHAYWAGFDPLDKDVGLNVADMAYTVQGKWNKPVVVTEAGHPSDGPANKNAQTSLSALELSAQQYEKWSRIRNVPMYFFEPFDGDWKKRWLNNVINEIDYHFGLRDCARNPKNIQLPPDGAILD